MVNSCLGLSNTSFILLLSLGISVAFLLCICFSFSPSLNEFSFVSVRSNFGVTFLLYFIKFDFI